MSKELLEASRDALRILVTPTGFPDAKKGRTAEQQKAFDRFCSAIAKAERNQGYEPLAFVKKVDEMIRMGRPSDHLWDYCVTNRERVIARAEGKAVQS